MKSCHLDTKIMGQYVTRNGKTYYKADSGELYKDYLAATLAMDSTPGEDLQRLGRATSRALSSIGSGISDYFSPESRRQRGINIGAIEGTPLERAEVGQPLVLGGKLGYKAADGTWQPRGEMDAPVPGVTGDAVYDGQKYSYLDPIAPTPALVTGLDSTGAVDRRQSDDYKAARAQYETTPAGQYQRYFKSPEFDYVFGSGARGEGAPKDAAAMEALGSQLKADPESRNIASMYAAQSAMGRINQDAIQKMYEGDKNMQAWAKANPMLAQREYLKSQERQAAGMPLAPDQENVQGDLGTGAQGVGGWNYEQLRARGAGREQSPSPLVQQEMQQEATANQAAKATTAGMSAVDKVNEFVKRFRTPPGAFPTEKLF